jgi:hypothetical protein
LEELYVSPCTGRFQQIWQHDGYVEFEIHATGANIRGPNVALIVRPMLVAWRQMREQIVIADKLVARWSHYIWSVK